MPTEAASDPRLCSESRRVPQPSIAGPAAAQASEPPADINLSDAYVRPTPAAEPQPGESNDLPKTLPGTGSSLRDWLLLSGLVVTALALGVLALLYAARRRYNDPLLR